MASPGAAFSNVALPGSGASLPSQPTLARHVRALVVSPRGYTRSGAALSLQSLLAVVDGFASERLVYSIDVIDDSITELRRIALGTEFSVAE
jgi:hypothetical protein